MGIILEETPENLEYIKENMSLIYMKIYFKKIVII